MALALIAGWLILACTAWQWRQSGQAPGCAAEALALGACLAAALAAAVGSLCTAWGLFSTPTLELALGGLAVLSSIAAQRSRAPALRTDRAQRRAAASSGDRYAWLLGLAFLGAWALRSPPVASPLGGQDQGSYTLRAQLSLRSGDSEIRDPVLARASSQASSQLSSVAAADLLGLFPIESSPARADVYEGAYRPGFYLRDRDTGAVQPQFFALHPAGLQLAGRLFGPARVHWWMFLCAGVSLACFALALRRLWGSAWACFGLLCLGLSPLAIWTQRITLSEGTFFMLLMGAWLAGCVGDASARDAHHAHDRGAKPAHARSMFAWSMLLLALATWCRGEGWIWGPALALALWWRSHEQRGGLDAGRIFVVVFAAGVVVHADLAFAYVHDEVLRRVDALEGLRPGHLQAAAVGGVALWCFADLRIAKARANRPQATPNDLTVAWRLPALLALLMVGVHFIWRLVDPLAHGRLDPLPAATGWPLLLLALIALAAPLVARTELRAGTPSADRNTPTRLFAWLVLLSVALYLPRGMPSAHLYYYGRYLVPLLVPATIVLAIVAQARLSRRSAAWPRAIAIAVRTLVAGLALAGISWPMAYGSAWPLHERQGVDDAIEWLASQLPPNAIVIAGGEGWHRGFTDHQVATALWATHGLSVLPTRTREDAVTSSYALLDEGLAMDRPVYWLVNEASHHYRRGAPTQGAGPAVFAGADLLLPADLKAASLTHFELWSHRHTPTQGVIPTRRTRDGMRMSLAKIERRPAPVLVLHPSDATKCLPFDTTIELPTETLAGFGQGAGELVLVLDPLDAAKNLGVVLEVDGRRHDFAMVSPFDRPRATVGPVELPTGFKSLRLRGFAPRDPTTHTRTPSRLGSGCPHGRWLEARWLPAPHPAAQDVQATAHTFVPRDDMGHAFKQSRWTRARALSRFRPGPRELRAVRGMSLRLDARHNAHWDPLFLPAGVGEYQVIATLAATELNPSVRLELRIDGRVVQVIDPPDSTRESWQGPKLSWHAQGASAHVELRIVNAGPEDWLDLRDIGVFSIEDGVAPQVHISP